MANLSGSQKRLYELLIKNDGQWFRRSSLPLLLGYTNDDGMQHAVKFPEMVDKGLIEQRRLKDGTEYRTNIRSRVGG